MRFNLLFENIMNGMAGGPTVKLSDLYDYDEFSDDSEALHDFTEESDYDKSFVVKSMNPETAKKLQTFRDDMTVIDAYDDFATKEQKNLVKWKMRNYDNDRIVVIAGKTLVDGNHHVVAAILSGKPIKYIDLHS